MKIGNQQADLAVAEPVSAMSAMSDEHWFKPNTHGYGMGASIGLLASPARNGIIAEAWQIILFLAGSAVMTTALLWISKRKTDGEWAWRPPRAKQNITKNQHLESNQAA